MWLFRIENTLTSFGNLSVGGSSFDVIKRKSQKPDPVRLLAPPFRAQKHADELQERAESLPCGCSNA